MFNLRFDSLVAYTAVPSLNSALELSILWKDSPTNKENLIEQSDSSQIELFFFSQMSTKNKDKEAGSPIVIKVRYFANNGWPKELDWLAKMINSTITKAMILAIP